MKLVAFAASTIFFASITIQAETSSPILLWPDGAPGALGKTTKDIPHLLAYLPKPEKASGAALLICPGGGYFSLNQRSGTNFAAWFSEQGIASFVLNYRLGGTNGYRWPIPFDDARRGMRLIRSRAADFRIDPKKIGVIGASAGGHLAAMMITATDDGKPDASDPIERQSSRPNFGILSFAVISFSGPEAHIGSRDNILGKNPPLELTKQLSPELLVNAKTPPCFIWHTEDDNVVSVDNSLNFAGALRRAKVPFALHIYEHGPHGLGLHVEKTNTATPFHPWTADCLFWLKENGCVK